MSGIEKSRRLEKQSRASRGMDIFLTDGTTPRVGSLNSRALNSRITGCEESVESQLSRSWLCQPCKCRFLLSTRCRDYSATAFRPPIIQ